jgi:hypothetical protein
MTTPEERVKLLKAEAQRLEQYLDGLPEEAWLHPSACDEWTVADVIAHLTSAIGSHAKYITDAFEADAVNPESLPHRTNQRQDASAAAERVISLELSDICISIAKSGSFRAVIGVAYTNPYTMARPVHKSQPPRWAIPGRLAWRRWFCPEVRQTHRHIVIC